MRILLVSNYQPPHLGGIEYAAEALQTCWTRQGHQVTWLTTDIPKGARPDRRSNIRLPAWNSLESMLEINTPLLHPGQRPVVRRLVQQAEIINIHSLAPGVTEAARHFALKEHKPLVCTQHVGVIPLKQAFLNRLQRSILLKAARKVVRSGYLTFVGEAVREWFIAEAGLPEERVAMTPAGIDADLFSFVSDGERGEARRRWELRDGRLQVFFVGRFVEKKGLPILKELAHSLPDIDFTLLGNGPLDPKRWSLPNVRIMDHVSSEDLRLLYGAHDLFIMPSHGEGWPAVVPQAMACGLPCLISEDCFDGYRQDRQRFRIAPRNAAAMAEHLRAAAGDIPGNLGDRKARSIYALMTWNWGRTASIYLNLFERTQRQMRDES